MAANPTRGAMKGTGRSSAAMPTRDEQSPLARFLATFAGRAGSRAVLVGLILLIWEFAPVARATRFWLSSPSMILGTLWDWIFDGTVWAHLESTLLVMAEGYVIGCVAGIGLGLLLGFFPRLSRVLAPVLASLYALPKIALAPL